MELTRKEVKNIAELAKLALSEAEITRYASQLSDCFDYFQRLQELDTAHIEPTASVLPLKNVLRADASAPALEPDQVVANAPDASGDQFRVSAVLGEE